jgi:hypothetical protein
MTRVVTFNPTVMTSGSQAYRVDYDLLLQDLN